MSQTSSVDQGEPNLAPCSAADEPNVGGSFRSRNYRFTWNNPTDGVKDHLLGLAGVKYIVFGYEIAPNTGTPHYQGTVVFAQPKTLKALKKLFGPQPWFGRCDFLQASIEYCLKDGDTTEKGDRPVTKTQQGDTERDRWATILDCARSGEHESLTPKIRFNHGKLLCWHRQQALRERQLEDTTDMMLWYYGPTGSGKSKAAREQYPDAFLKMCNRWWDSYNEEDSVIIEDFDRNHEKLCHYLKLWADRYPFPCEVKGGMFKIRPRMIVVTSNYHPEEIWTHESDLGPLLRRFKCMYFPKFGEPPIHRQTLKDPDTPPGNSWTFVPPTPPPSEATVPASPVEKKVRFALDGDEVVDLLSDDEGYNSDTQPLE